ncbi:glutamate-cysteine ligase family protein [Spiribacter halobius]|uniref:Glutamate--cysteine ligase n=1 Tax=Sediminicurvatus halobius TaxID=2182432 RepID=A0A2U2N7S1_9GAMM|nr:glutamate-cysteine ligase family protein [Spiribacter halobius]PWG65245.1 glutamate--cysteine ligase [Spiribacter halobius]UEX78799.1 glutamate-cysteine ligase family protein [Spiribacter halobius]
MGTEIRGRRFTESDFRRFRQALTEETERLRQWQRTGRLAAEPACIGAEVEAWLVDALGRPAALNTEVIDAVADGRVVPELARYNLELNTHPRRLAGRSLSAMADELGALAGRVAEIARGRNGALVFVGILPSLRHEDLDVAHMTPLARYRALNEQVLLLRNREPLGLEIDGAEPLRCAQSDVMLEAAATSLQVHLQVAPAEAARVYNAAVVLSAATVALAANAPALFGHSLWEESRIPLFEQAVEMGPPRDGHAGPRARVTFGSGYAREGLFELFRENLERYAVLLPVTASDDPARLPHLTLHNGTIWRWNRPLVGFDGQGRPHLRVEHRVMSAGPTVTDMVANAAFFFGAACGLAARSRPIESELSFAVAEDNFYRAAREGLAATVRWPGGERPLRGLILDELLPLAHLGLQARGVPAGEAESWLAPVAERVARGRTGSAWQRAWRARHGRDRQALVLAYLARQRTGVPVHRWDVD